MKGSDLLRQIFSFAGVGGLATVTHVSIALACAHWLSWGSLASNGLGAAVAFCVSYFGNELLTFGNERRRRESIWRYALTSFAGFLVASAIMAIVNANDWPVIVYAIATIVIVPPITFVLARTWVFRKPDCH